MSVDYFHEAVTIEHIKDFTLIGHLHGGCTGIGITGNDVLAEPLSCNHKLFTQLSRA